MTSWFQAAGYDFQEFTANGLRTFAVVEGQSGGFPLVLLHSIPAASFVWSTTIQAIGRSSRIIAPDLPGWGRSHNRIAPVDFRLTRESLSAWLTDVISAQQCERCDIAGLGDGAWLAMEFVREHANKVRRLGLLNLPIAPKILPARRWPWQKQDWTGRRLTKWLADTAGLTDALESQFDELFAGGWHVERSPEFPSSEYLREIKAYRDRLRNFEGEILLGWGANSAGFDKERAEWFAQGRHIEVWENAGEFPMWEQPEQFASEMREFFGQ
ncbi:MAG: alpha/beta hydrolase [Calditrichaeota bacterium]|nr:alpha/beta hydrolase [Calditrichota bacterium]MCB9369796.1 alpha/beta hydrolase [Calditrichota bacterium]